MEDKQIKETAQEVKPKRGRRAATVKTDQQQEQVETEGMVIEERIFHVQQEADNIAPKTQAFHYDYANYSTIWGEIKQLFCKYNLVYICSSETVLPGGDGSVLSDGTYNNSSEFPFIIFHCSIIAKDNVSESKTFNVPIAVGSDQKEVGKSLTYYRRYGLLSLLGLCVLRDAEDVDADPTVQYSGKTDPKPTEFLADDMKNDEPKDVPENETAFIF